MKDEKQYRVRYWTTNKIRSNSFRLKFGSQKQSYQLCSDLGFCSHLILILDELLDVFIKVTKLSFYSILGSGWLSVQCTQWRIWRSSSRHSRSALISKTLTFKSQIKLQSCSVWILFLPYWIALIHFCKLDWNV